MKAHQSIAMLFGASVAVICLAAGCGSDASDELRDAKGGSSSGGSAGARAGAPASGAGRSGNPSGGSPDSTPGGAGGEGSVIPGQGGQGGEETRGGAGHDGGGAGGESGEAASCDRTRETLLRPIGAVSAGSVEVMSAPQEAVTILRVDASAGGFMAAADNPYVYVNLGTQLRVDVTDIEAAGSTAWDLALKRDCVRANCGDSGSGAAQVAALPGANFESVTADAASAATFRVDDFVDDESCQPVVDATGKPVTSFDGWYDYDAAAMTLAPADKVFLVRAANGKTLYKLQITSYYQELADGQGGTLRKSGVFELRYQLL